MSNAIARIKEFHSTGSFGTQQRLKEAEEQTREAYRSLGPNEIEALVVLALESEPPSKAGLAEDILRNLACLRPGSLAPFHGRLIERQLYYPAVAYHGATSEIAKRILKALVVVGTSNRLTTNHMLCDLAWIGGEVVQEAFDSWRRNPPLWASSLHVPPHAYAQQAGWELTADGGRRDLFLRECHPLVEPGSVNANPNALRIAYEHEDLCLWCGRKLVTLLNLDLSRPEFAFLEVHGKRLRLATCPVCTCYGTLFTAIGFDGTAQWHPGNEKPGYLPHDTGDWPPLPFDALAFGNASRHWIEAADWCSLSSPSSQLGGHPTWIQDACYPGCPECGRQMVFVAQLAVEEIEEYSEGIYYMHLCESCGVAATHYQQS